MRNPEVTKETILKKSGILFNTQGYKATSISNITDATGLTKGAIYKHFSNKTELEQQTMAHLSGLLFTKMRDIIKNEKTAGDKLRAIFSFFETYISNPPLQGGCPLLNAAIESDDNHPSLRKESLKTLTTLRQSVMHILDKGIEHKQIKPDIDKDFYASLIIAGLEGSVMMSKLEGNNTDIVRMIKHLNKQLTEIEI